MRKIIYPVLIFAAVLAISVNAFSIANLFDGFFSPPLITDASLSFEKVIPGDELIITVSAEDTFGIKEVKAEIEHERGTDKIEFLLVSGDNKKGTWEGTWNVHDTIEKKLYKAKVTVVNRHNSEAKAELLFEDPVVSHTPEQITPQGAGSGLDADKLDAYQAADLLAQSSGGGVLVTIGWAINSSQPPAGQDAPACPSGWTLAYAGFWAVGIVSSGVSPGFCVNRVIGFAASPADARLFGAGGYSASGGYTPYWGGSSTQFVAFTCKVCVK